MNKKFTDLTPQELIELKHEIIDQLLENGDINSKQARILMTPLPPIIKEVDKVKVDPNKVIKTNPIYKQIGGNQTNLPWWMNGVWHSTTSNNAVPTITYNIDEFH